MEKKHRKHYFESDGNGGFNVSKSILGTLAIFLTLIGMIASGSFYYGNVNNKVENLEYSINTRIMPELKILTDNQYTQGLQLTIFNQKQITMEKDIDLMQSDISSMKSDIQDIKLMLKEMQK
jgi:hypothetical protein